MSEAVKPLNFDWSTSLVYKDDPSSIEQYLGGTEVRNLVVFDGKIFAGNGHWMDTESKGQLPTKTPGAKILVLEESNGIWKTDLSLDEMTLNGQRRYLAISALHSITIYTDKNGIPLDKPVPLLIAGTWDYYNALEVFVKEIGSSSWEKSTIKPASEPPVFGIIHIRSITSYVDRITNVNRIFVGLNDGVGIGSGVYDPTVEGKILWDTEVEAFIEPPDDYDRVTSFVEINDKLFATVCGKLYERQDGKPPSWKKVVQHPNNDCPKGPGENGFRGATAIKGSNNTEYIMMGFEGNTPSIEKVQLPNYILTTDLDVKAYLNELWDTNVLYAIIAYNHATPYRLPNSNEEVLFFGIEAKTNRTGNWNEWEPGAYFFIRREDGEYIFKRIIDKSHVGPQDQPLVAVRDMVVSPFPEDNGLVIYACGFDANHRDCHNTGWIYRGVYKK
ncbi:MAG: hypothetical protein GY855_05760 [candidate division Zixibacteria bacterium]|nr:hypothetical protein [candidate division Zixibacteria bacterium]